MAFTKNSKELGIALTAFTQSLSETNKLLRELIQRQHKVALRHEQTTQALDTFIEKLDRFLELKGTLEIEKAKRDQKKAEGAIPNRYDEEY